MSSVCVLVMPCHHNIGENNAVKTARAKNNFRQGPIQTCNKIQV